MLHHETPTIYIDGGSNNINGIVASWQTNGVRLPHLPQYCFEPNPRYADGYKGNTTLITKAIWISDEVIPFYLSRDRGSFGSSIFGHKLTRIKQQLLPYMRPEPILVECIDFSQWLLDNIPAEYRVVLKLDIEGAEYEVLQKMLKDGSIHLLDELYAEFHFDRIGMSRKEHRRITEEVRSTGVIFKRWQ